MTCQRCGTRLGPSRTRLCTQCGLMEHQESRTDGGTLDPDVDPDPRNDIIRHIAAASRVLRRRSKRNHEHRRDQLDALIRRVRHDRISQAELRNELRAHYTSDDVVHVDATYELRSAAQHAARYSPEAHADPDSIAEVNSGP